jgi:hypothetical protein
MDDQDVVQNPFQHKTPLEKDNQNIVCPLCTESRCTTKKLEAHIKLVHGYGSFEIADNDNYIYTEHPIYEIPGLSCYTD